MRGRVTQYLSEAALAIQNFSSLLVFSLQRELCIIFVFVFPTCIMIPTPLWEGEFQKAGLGRELSEGIGIPESWLPR